MSVGPLRTLRHRQFRILWVAGSLSAFGTWMQVTALGIFAAESTGKAAWVGTVLAASFLATGLLTAWAGPLADRHDRRKVVAAAVLAQLVVSGGLVAAFLLDYRSPALLTMAALCEGALYALSAPALTALIADLVPAEELPQANALQQVSWNGARALSPLLAVWVLAVSSYEMVFVLNGLSFVAIAAAMALLVERPRTRADAGSGWQRLREGITAVRMQSKLRMPVLIGVAEMALAAPFIALIPAMAQLTLGAGPSGTAALFTAVGVAGSAGALVLAALTARLDQERLALAMLATMGVCGVAYAYSPNIWAATALIVPLGAVHSYIFAVTTGLLQRDADPAIRGRVLALYFATTGTAYGASSLALAALADVVGLRTVLAGGSLCGLLAALLLARRSTSPGVEPFSATSGAR